MIRISQWLFTLGVLVLIVGSHWSVRISIQDKIVLDQIQYLDGTLELHKIQDPQDKESIGLSYYLEKLDLKRD